jgi:phosphate transport system substrate-binding protein
MKLFGHRFVAFVTTCLVGLTPAAFGAEISGAGATFPNPVYQKWAEQYLQETGIKVIYQPVGSGLGIKLIQEQTVTFGASDMPMKPQDLDKLGLIQFPTVIGGDVPVVNLRGVGPGQLILDGPTLADIYLGKINNWSDPAIRKLNPRLALPAQPIMVFYRTDGSGTTFIWTDYLSKSSTQWKEQVGADTSVDWPTGVGARGNEGVASTIALTNGAIGYVEYTYALQHSLSYTKVINRSGKAIAPSIESFAAAAEADWASAPKFFMVLTDQPGENAWPIAGATFILMRKQPRNMSASAAALAFFKWAYEHGDDLALGLNYVPLPDGTVVLIEASWTQIQGPPPSGGN